MLTKDTLLAQLNDSQRQAVEYNAGPLLVIAGAGSGKTRMLTYKVAYLIQEGIRPWNILALTFTNKAANEMKERVVRLVGEQAQKINMGTFHSIFARILHQEAAAIGLTQQFSIYDESDSQSLLRTIIKEMNLDDKQYKPSAVHRRISLAKNNMISARLYAADAEIYERDRQARMPFIGKIFTAYEQRCKTANAVDFDDLLLLTHHLFLTHDDLRRKWEEKFQYILVDEYQDTNKVQQAVLEQLTRARQHICVVGDDAQSIYAFRGANIDNILLFADAYPNAKLFKLERNYRSTQKIVQAANSLISHNKRQISKAVFSENELGENLMVTQAFSDTEEAAIVCNDIARRCRQEGINYDDCAILYRTNAQSRLFEDAFRSQGIPYRVYGGLSFYQHREIKDIIAYIRLVVNSDDEEALKRVINYPARGIGATTIAKIGDVAANKGVSYWQVCANIDDYEININSGTKTKIRHFVGLIKGFQQHLDSEDAYTLGHEIIMQSGIHKDIFAATDNEAVARQENINEFDHALNNFVEERQETELAADISLTHFLQEVSLATDRESNADATSRVALMTVHAAKGLEFHTVYVVGLEENIFPSPRATSSAQELEEERRLLYVAITRAEKHCTLTYAQHRWRYGTMVLCMPSRFIAEIESLDHSQIERKRERKTLPKATVRPTFRTLKPQPKALSKAQTEPQQGGHSSDNRLHVGSKIEHERFGRGTVATIMGQGAETKAVVDFENMGRKILLLKFAKYSIVD